MSASPPIADVLRARSKEFAKCQQETSQRNAAARSEAAAVEPGLIRLPVDLGAQSNAGDFGAVVLVEAGTALGSHRYRR